MLKIRLQRTGRKHDPTFRVVLTDSKNGPKSGKFIEILGHYDARRNDDTELKTERIQHWIAKGAQPSDTVHNLLVKEKTITGKMRNVLPKKSPIIDEAKLKAEAEAKEAAEAKAKEESEAAAKEEVKEEEVVEEKKEEVKEEEVAEEKKEEVKEAEVKEEEAVGEKKEGVKEEEVAEEKKEGVKEEATE